MSNVTKFVPRPRSVQLACSACGAPGEGSCSCGAPYAPAGERAAQAVKENPRKSDRALAKEAGVGSNTIRRARPGAPCGAPEKAPSNQPDKRIGRDGKSYSAPPPSMAGRQWTAEDFDPEDGVTPEEIDRGNAIIRRRIFVRCAGDCARKAEQGAGLRYAKASEIDAEVLQIIGKVITAWSDLRRELKQRKEHPDEDKN